jgi:DNA polymerase I
MSKLVLIDGNAVLHRAYHALPSLTTRTGEPINAVYGLVSMLLKVIQDLKPTHIAVAFDRKELTFRHKEFKDYQAQRPPTEENLSSQFEKAKNVLFAMNIPAYEMAGFEADDLIGTLAFQSTEKLQSPIDKVIIVTGDRDILQLVDDRKGVSVYLPIRGLSDAKLMKEDDVVEKLGVRPSQIPDYKALVGDQSDNYKGVPGIGPKTAINLLNEFGGFEEIYKWVDRVCDGKEVTLRKAQAQRGGLKTQRVLSELKDKKVSMQAFQKLIDGRASGEMSYNLAQIVTDVDLKADLEKSKAWQVDNPRVLDLFTEFGFRTLKNRVKDVGKSIVSENQMKLL